MNQASIDSVVNCLMKLREIENELREHSYTVQSELMKLASVMDDTQFRALLQALNIPSKIKSEVWRISQTEDFQRVRRSKQSPMAVKVAG